MTTSLLIGELVLLLLAAVGFFIFLDIKRKKKLRESLGIMLDNIASEKPGRLTKLSEQLQSSFQLEEGTAKGLAEQLVKEEKLFFQQFFELQLGKSETGLNDFHERVYALLTHYLTALPSLEESKIEQEPSNNDDISVKPAEEPAAEEPAAEEPSWDEAFEETKKAEEPSWDEAFEEAGEKKDPSK